MHSDTEAGRPPMRGTIAIGGAVAQRPGRGGHAWVFLQYLLGFRQLGWEPLLVDWVSPDMCVDAAGEPCPVAESVNVRYLTDVMAQFGLSDSFVLLDDRGETVAGLARAEAVARLATAAFLLNVMGYVRDEAVLAAVPMRVFLDIDPGFGQMWKALELHDPFVGHERFVTIGQKIGQPDCAVPTGGLEWITTRPPVVLDHWPAQPPVATAPFTGIGAWRGPNAPIDFAGHTYGLRVHEFRKLASLPRATGLPFEYALDIDAFDAPDADLLEANGWVLVDPKTAAYTPAAYQQFIAESRAEFMVAKAMYVDACTGWFSDRSVCYLATGRPVIAQDTGLANDLPVGQGLLTFATLDEAIAATCEVAGNLERHSRAARQLAAEAFDSRIVLGALLANLGVA